MNKLRSTAITASFLIVGFVSTYTSPAFAYQQGSSPGVASLPPTGIQEVNSCNSPEIKRSPGGNIVESVDPSTRDLLNSLFTQQHLQEIPQSAVTIETTPEGDLIALDANGNRVASLDFSSIDGPNNSTLSGSVISSASAGDWLKGAAQGFAKAVAGCVGGVVGYDAILGVLEKRVSYWAFVKWLGGKVGWGLAVSCAAGSATAVLGW